MVRGEQQGVIIDAAGDQLAAKQRALFQVERRFHRQALALGEGNVLCRRIERRQIGFMPGEFDAVENAEGFAIRAEGCTQRIVAIDQCLQRRAQGRLVQRAVKAQGDRFVVRQRGFHAEFGGQP